VNRLTVFLILVAASSPCWCGDPIGRVILAAGEVEAWRDGRPVALHRDAEVQSGDEIRTGKASSAQIRFADTSIVALRPESVFRVDEFVFKAAPDGGEKAFFSLVKGGLRTITGAIGKLNKQNYGIVTPTSTIGIRGTHFSLMVCADNCRNADGSIAASGTYGGVIDGRISSTPNANPSATREFSRGEFFFAANASAAPQPLLAPPAFLADKLEAQRRGNTSPTSAATPAAATTASSTSSGTAAASSILADTAMPPADTTSTAAALPSVATETLTSSGTPAVINAVTGFIVQYFSGASYVTIDSCNATDTCQPNSVRQFSTSGTWLTGYSNDGGAPKGTVGGGTVVDSGAVSLNGAMFAWGRWTGAFTVTDSAGNSLSNLPSGVLYGMTDEPSVGNQTRVWPTSGLVSYTLAGGPSPIDTAGNTGTMNSMSGTLDFFTRNVTLNASLSMNVPTQGVANLSLNGGGTISTTNDNLRNASFASTCSGAGCASPSSSGLFDARFAGTAAQVMVVNGMAQNAVKDSSGTGTQSVLFLGVLKCASGC
jgi:hypothetical protein